MATGRIPGTSGSPLTAKGDIFAYSTTNARLPVGSDGQTLVANSAATTGLQWQAPVQQNPVLNSAFQVWQRGTSVSVAASTVTYTADRWQISTGANEAFTISRQATGDTTNLPSIQYAQRVQRNSGQTGTTIVYQGQAFETVNSIPFVGKTVTLSFYARAGANFTAASNNLGVALQTGTGTDQTLFGFTAAAFAINSAATLTTTWQRFTYTVALSSSITQLAPIFSYTPVGTAGAADYYEVTGVQLEVGSVATPFHTFSTTLQGELAACQRYYYRNSPATTGIPLGQGSANGTRYVIGVIALPVSMRVSPTSADFTALFATDGATAGSTVAALAAYGNSPTTATYYFDCTSGLTQYRNYKIETSSSSGYLGFSAEL